MSYDAQNWAKKLINQKINTHQLIAETYKETLRFMLGTFSGLKIINPENEVVDVPCINATSERTAAKFFQENNIILPVISIAQITSVDDERRRRIKDLVLNESLWDDTRKRAFRIISLAPRALTVTYNINIWAKYNEDMDQLVEQVRLAFSPNLNIITKYTNSTAAFITDESNDSVVVVGDREDRAIRRKFEVSVEGYIPYPKYLVTSTGEITEFNTETQTTFDASSINVTETQSYTKIN